MLRPLLLGVAFALFPAHAIGEACGLERRGDEIIATGADGSVLIQSDGSAAALCPPRGVSAIDATFLESSILLGTSNGLFVHGGACELQPTNGTLATAWITDLERGADGTVWLTTATSGAANDVYYQRPGSRVFRSAGLPSRNIWWQSIKAAPQKPTALYLSGYQIKATGPQLLLRRSLDGGKTWLPLLHGAIQTPRAATTRWIAVNSADENDALALSDDGSLYRTSKRGLRPVAHFLGPLASASFHEGRLAVLTRGGEPFHLSDDGTARRLATPVLDCLGSDKNGLWATTRAPRGGEWTLLSSPKGTSWQSETSAAIPACAACRVTQRRSQSSGCGGCSGLILLGALMPLRRRSRFAPPA